MGTVDHRLLVMHQPPKLCSYLDSERLRLSRLLYQEPGQAVKSDPDGLVIDLWAGVDHISPGREHGTLLPNLRMASNPAESRLVRILPRLLFAPPRVVPPRDPSDLLVGQHPVHSRHQLAHRSRVDEQHLASAVAQARRGGLVPRDEPQARGDLRREEELRRERDDAVDQVGLDDRAADLALAALL